MRRAALVVAISVALVAVLGSPACRTATQVTVELRTSGFTCDQVKGVAIVVAQTPAAAEGKMRSENLSAQVTRGECGTDPHVLGTLVITPGGATGAVVVRARVSDAADAPCTAPDYKGCIVSRRAFAFLDHASATLPITLELSCKDIACNEQTSCRTGRCVSSSTTCSAETSACESPAEPMVLPDGGVLLPDGAIAPDDGATVDGSLPDGAGVDATADADAADAAVEAGSNYGNNCPRSAIAGGDIDCHAMVPAPQDCCRNGAGSGFYCAIPTSCPPADDQLPCTGRKWCGADYCCASSTPVMKRSSCQPYGNCRPTTGIFLCTTNDDCPPDERFCSTSVFYIAAGNGGPVRRCATAP